MTKYLIALLLALPALAQAAPPFPECIPGVRGHPVSYPRSYSTSGYWHVAWFCLDAARDKATKAHVFGFTCRAGKCDEYIFSAAVYAVTRASAKVGTARTFWNEHVRTDCTAATPDDPALCAARNAWIADNRETWAREVRDEMGWKQP